ncbi:phospholipase A [Neisseria leonii]|uniref:phospholipase A n=1 Tax=Neisseria leonii TaxID=2995413 RepID=UPI00237A7131|nr:phospholipase A [Neisseria sp. 3986]MDD9325097.1 phospholipase A [Neisseria sp. 3986]
MWKQIVCLLLVLPVQARAQDAAACAAVADNAQRLACYDRLFPPAGYSRQNGMAAEVKAPVDLVQTLSESAERREVAVVLADDAASELRAAEAYTPLSEMFDLNGNRSDGLFTLRGHAPTYLLPVWYNTRPNYYPSSPSRGVSGAEKFYRQKRAESKMQLSFKSKLMEDVFASRADVWFAYTQKSDWQIFNQGRKSAPFRNTDYQPELFVTQPVTAELPGGGRLRVLGLGYVHQSNGQSRPDSRSWNRVYAMAGMEWGRLTVLPRVWVRTDTGPASSDDNPDITDYMGYGDMRLQYRFNGKQTLSALLRYNPASGKGAVEAAYAAPLKGKMKAYIRAFHGYGENLMDYNHKQTGVGIGLMFNDWDGI